MELMELTDGYFSPFWRRLPYGDPGPDPTGLVKGWAAQQASDILVSRGLPDHVVNAAGDIVVSGQAAPGDPACPWRVGISDPHRAGALVGVVDLDQTVVEVGRGDVRDRRAGRPRERPAHRQVPAIRRVSHGRHPPRQHRGRRGRRGRLCHSPGWRQEVERQPSWTGWR